MTWLSQPDWVSHLTPPPLATDAGHLWRIRLSLTRPLDDALFNTLTDEEITRARRYLRTEHGSLWAQSRRALRTLLAHYTGADARSLTFTTGPHGKPHLDPAHDLAFNLSHSHEWALLGIVPGHTRKLGVDVERCADTRDLHAMARRVFSPAERRRIANAQNPDELLRRFYAIWTQKEAYIKALGTGLSLPLDSFDVDDIHHAVLDARHPGARSPSEWYMAGGQLAPNYACALCLDAPPMHMHLFSWPTDELAEEN